MLTWCATVVVGLLQPTPVSETDRVFFDAGPAIGMQRFLAGTRTVLGSYGRTIPRSIGAARVLIRE